MGPSTYIQNIFQTFSFFILEHREQNYPCSFGRGTCTVQRGFVLHTPCLENLSSWTLNSFSSCLPWSPCCGFPSGHSKHSVETLLCHLPFLMPQPLLPLHVDMPSHPPWSPRLLMFQWDEISLGKPTRFIDKTHCNSWLLHTLPVCLLSWLSLLFTEALPEVPLHFPPLILYMVFLIKGEYPITCFFEKPRAHASFLGSP